MSAAVVTESDPCAAAGPLKAKKTIISYTGKGVFSEIKLGSSEDSGTLGLYTIQRDRDASALSDGSKSPAKVLVVLYDIFGWNEESHNVFAFSDRLLEQCEGVSAVIMPDFFSDQPWKIGAPMGEEFAKWIQGVGFPPNHLNTVRNALFPHISSVYGISTKVGLVGLCWGGLLAVMAGGNSECTSGLLNSVACIHGSRITKEVISSLRVPLYYGPTPKDTSIEVVKSRIDEFSDEDPSQKRVKDLSVYHLFDGLSHGFCGARGEWSESEVGKGVSKALSDLQTFFESTLS